MKLLKPFKFSVDESSIIAICVVRDEELLIPAFINHYKSLKVSHFVFIFIIDNGSTDNSIEYLLARSSDLNIQIWQTEDSYSENSYGLDWVNKTLNDQFKNHWCLVVDIDEFILPRGFYDLPSLAKSMKRDKCNILATLLIDFYPESFDVDNYEKFGSPFIHSNLFDKMSENSVFYHDAKDGSKCIKGGMRHRISDSTNAPSYESVCLTKRSFFNYDFYDTHHLDVGMHWIIPNDFENWGSYNNWEFSNKYLKFYHEINIIAHFKFIKPNLSDYFQKRISLNQDWDNSSEYKKYLKNLKKSFYTENFSLSYRNQGYLYNYTIDQIL